MFVGKVIGTVWSTVKWPQVQGLKLLLVRPYHLADLADLADLATGDPTGTSGAPAPGPAAASDPRPDPRGGPDCEAVVCVDLLDAGVGDDVIVAFGHAARVAAQSEGLRAGPLALGFGRSGSPQSLGAGLGAAGLGAQASAAPTAVIPIDAAVVAIVDSIAVARPST